MKDTASRTRSMKTRLTAGIIAVTGALGTQITVAEESVAAANIRAIYQPAAAFTGNEAGGTLAEVNLMQEKVREWRDPSAVNGRKRQSEAADFAGPVAKGDVAMENIRNIFAAYSGA